MPHLSAEDRKLPTRSVYDLALHPQPGLPQLRSAPRMPTTLPDGTKAATGTWALCSRTPKGDRSPPGPGSGHEDQGTPPPGLEAGAGESSEPLSPSSPHPPRSLARSFPAARWPFLSASTRLLCPSPRLALAVHSCQNYKFMFQNNQQKINHITFLIQFQVPGRETVTSPFRVKCGQGQECMVPNRLPECTPWCGGHSSPGGGPGGGTGLNPQILHLSHRQCWKIPFHSEISLIYRQTLL